MTNTTVTARRFTGEGTLKAAAGFWLAMALIGQWAFFAYIAAFYGPSTATGNFEAWAGNRMLNNAYRAGDTTGNLVFAAHALLAGVIAFGGALQLIPWVRARFPRFHRWNGRVFLVTAVGVSLAGFFLIYVRKPVSEAGSHIAITGNGLLILAFAALAWRKAVGRDFVAHRRWAMRLYLVSNAQWFMRVGAFAWIMINQALGQKVSFSGPFFPIWAFGCYLVPLAVLEVYLRARDGGGPVGRLSAAGLILAMTLLMIGGTVVFSMFSLGIVRGDA